MKGLVESTSFNYSHILQVSETLNIWGHSPTKNAQKCVRMKACLK